MIETNMKICPLCKKKYEKKHRLTCDECYEAFLYKYYLMDKEVGKKEVHIYRRMVRAKLPKVSITKKYCPQCKETKDTKYFARYLISKDGYFPMCRVCHKMYRRKEVWRKDFKCSVCNDYFYKKYMIKLFNDNLICRDCTSTISVEESLEKILNV